jgi:hypothetical protein
MQRSSTTARTAASTIAAAILAVGALGFAAPSWAQKSISDMDSPEEKSTGDSAPASAMSMTPDIHLRLLSRSEGREIVDLALTETANPDEKPDCSHLMQQIFDEAGFGYPYATSYQLYDGVPEFQRVERAQPGDLIVWQGHVGLVVDPSAHSFYSSVGTGLETQQYDNDYWRRRGRPRFYRYLVGADADDTATARPAQHTPAPTRIAGAAGVGTSAANRSASTSTPKPTGLGYGTDSRSGNVTIAGGSSQSASSTAIGRTVVDDTRDETAALYVVPGDIPIPGSHAKPTSEDVSQAISELANESGNILRANDLGTLTSSVVIFDQLQVEKVEIHHDRSWANVRIDYRVELKQGAVRSEHHTDKRRWELEHTPDGWVAVNPTDRLYVPASTAAQIISERLYQLTKKSAGKNRSQQASLARLLDAVFN